MTISRRDFLAVAGLLGVGGMATGCGEWFTDEIATGGDAQLDSERVIIVGAGAAGMATAHLLAQRGVDFQMLEAGSTHGGRIKRTNNFVDFPIALGGEWLHVEEATLARIVNDDTVEITQAMAAYDPDDLAGVVEDGVVAYERAGSWPDLKFVGSTWLDFFDEYIVPGIADRMVFDTQILRIEHGGDEVVLTDANNTVWVADRIVFTAPMKVLQDGDIFIKTSTGKVSPAATMPVVLVMLEAIRDAWFTHGIRIGMKPAGGIRTAKQALHYLVMVKETLDEAWLDPALFRFGASSLLDDLVRQYAKQLNGRYMAPYDVTSA